MHEIQKLLTLVGQYLDRAKNSAVKMNSLENELSSIMLRANATLRNSLVHNVYSVEHIHDNIEIHNKELLMTMAQNETISHLCMAMSYLLVVVSHLVEHDSPSLHSQVLMQLNMAINIIKGRRFNRISFAPLAIVVAQMEAKLLVNNNFNLFVIRRKVSELRIQIS